MFLNESIFYAIKTVLPTRCFLKFKNYSIDH